MALYHSGVVCELREVVLKNKPTQMLAASPKGTVPVLVLPTETLDQSVDIMHWALLQPSCADDWQSQQLSHYLVGRNDDYFKSWLDRYKYFDRHPQAPQSHYFEQASLFLAELEAALVEDGVGGYALLTPEFSAIDAAIFPFVRQFAFVNKPQFDNLAFPKLLYWLEQCLVSALFLAVMDKYPEWSDSQVEPVKFGRNL